MKILHVSNPLAIFLAHIQCKKKKINKTLLKKEKKNYIYCSVSKSIIIFLEKKRL